MKHFVTFLAAGLLLTAALPFAHASTCSLATQTSTTKTIDFCGASSLPYSEYGYTVSNADGGTWGISANGGYPAPSLFDDVSGGKNGNSPDVFQINSVDGSGFLFDDLYLATDPGRTINYTITGFNANGSVAWSSGPTDFLGVGQSPNNVCSTLPNSGVGTGNLCYAEITASDAIAASYVQISISAGPDPGVYVDDIALTATPEPSSLMLLGTGLVSACGAIYRKRRASIA